MFLHFLPRLMLVLLLLGTALAQNTRNETVYLSVNIEQMMEFLGQNGFSAETGEDDEGEAYIEIKLGEFSPTLYLSDCNKKSQCAVLLLQWGMDLDEAVDLKTINQFNHDQVFVQAFLDEDHDPWMSSALDLTGGVTRKNIINWIGMFGRKLAEFAEAIDEGVRSGRADSLAESEDLAPASSIRMLLQLWNNRFQQML